MDYIIARTPSSDTYSLWQVTPHGQELFTPVTVKDPHLPAGQAVVGIGNYLLSWDKLAGHSTCFYPYQLLAFDPSRANPLGAVQAGVWPRPKFWGTVADIGNADGAAKEFQNLTELRLIPMGSFLLNFIPTDGRGTFRLFNFDPCQADPLPETPYYPQGAFAAIDGRDELLPIAGYVITRRGAAFRLWSFDPQQPIPLAHPVVQEGTWEHIGHDHRLVVVGDHVLDYLPATRAFRLWRFDPSAPGVLVGPLRKGVLPDPLARGALVAFTPRTAAATDAGVPGSIAWMRAKIKHVVYYMLENRSFDHICGWLYEHDHAPLRFVGPDHPFDGATAATTKYNGGALSPGFALDLPREDPYHDYADVMRQMFGQRARGYELRERPDMSGFLWNNGNPNVMGSYTPAQAAVLNGLAKGFAISDAWFCSMPGGTDANRAFSLTGSSLGQLNNFQNGVEYKEWPDRLHRPSIFKALWSHGITDFKIYNSVEWLSFVFTQHLFLAGQIPTVDADTTQRFVAGYDQFLADARAGTLPAFSYVEPKWVGEAGTTSYHPGPDIIPGEQRLAEIYEALRAGPAWEDTLLVVTFDEHGGIYDHVAPPYAANPYPNDMVDGFRFDLLGVRVPTLLVSPWIDDRTVFRSTTDVPYDATSFLATLLHWFGVPPSGWWLGERTRQAPTFEGVLRRATPRSSASLPQPRPAQASQRRGEAVHDLQRLVTYRVLVAELPHLSAGELQRLAHDILGRARDTETLTALIRAAIRSHS